MTLNEAIEHLQEKLNENNWPCEECYQEHVQLLYWLIELKERRNLGDQYNEYHLNRMINELKLMEGLLKKNET